MLKLNQGDIKGGFLFLCRAMEHRGLRGSLEGRGNTMMVQGNLSFRLQEGLGVHPRGRLGQWGWVVMDVRPSVNSGVSSNLGSGNMTCLLPWGSLWHVCPGRAVGRHWKAHSLASRIGQTGDTCG